MKTGNPKTAATPAPKEQSSFFAKESGQDFFGPAADEAAFFSDARKNRTAPVQAKLSVGPVNDPFEREADQMADQVVQHGGGNGSADQVKKAGTKKVSRKPIFESNAEREEDMPSPVQRKGDKTAEPVATDSLQSTLNSGKGKGERLPPEVNHSMSRAFGSDFSQVSIHRDAGAASLSNDLRAQAFTHGNDIYFNSGKYDPATQTGKHLLAHELTHTIQQGSGGTSHSVNRAPEIQREPDKPAEGKNVKDISSDDLKKMRKSDSDSFLTKNADGKVEVRFVHFPSKQYVGRFVQKDKQGNEYLSDAPYLKPTQERKTKQSTVWKAAALPLVTALLDKFIKNGQITGTEYQLVLKKDKLKAVTGTLDQIAKQLTVPFWGMDGIPISYQIEHKVDWQIAGGNHNVDVISNLILLDAKSNMDVGQVILKSMDTYYDNVINYYTKQKKVEGLVNGFSSGKGMYNIFCEDLVADGKDVGQSLISISNFESTAVQTPFTEANIEVSDLKIPDNHFVLKTAISGAGMFVPYELNNDFIEITWDKTANELTKISLKNVVKDEHGVLDKNNPNKDLNFRPDGGKRRYKVDSAGFALVLKNMFRGIKAMSPIEWSDIEFNPLTGLNASGKITTGLDFLSDVKIGMEVENSDFTIYATIESQFLKGKLPKPFDVDYSSLTLFAGTKKKFGAEGEVGFGVEKIGKGTIKLLMAEDNFGLEGKFQFTEKASFKKAELTFTYKKESEKGIWGATGEIIFDDKLVKGVKTANVKIGYENNVFSGKGTADLSIPKFKAIELTGLIKTTGEFVISATVKLDSLPGVKDVNATITVQKTADKYILSMGGTATPVLPKVPGLTLKPLTISYLDEIFKIEGGANYKKGMIDGSLTLGVTDGVVDADGKLTTASKGESKLTIYGTGDANIQLLKDVKAGIHAALDPGGSLIIWGELAYDKDLLETIHKPFNLFSISQNVPLLGVPFCAVVLRFGGKADFVFDWKPLHLHIATTLQKTSLENLEKGALGGEIEVGLNSEAQAKIELTLSIGIGVELAVVTVSLNGNGTLGFGIKGDMGGKLKGNWSTEKGLTLKEAKVDLSAGFFALAKLSGTILVELNLLVSKVNLYTYELGSVEKTFDLKDYSLTLTLPMKINSDGKLEGVDFKNMTLSPEFKKGNELELLKRAAGSDTTPVPSREELAKNAIRQEVRSKIQSISSRSSVDLYSYTSNLRSQMQRATPDLSMFINQVVEEELGSFEQTQFEDFRKELLSSKDGLKEKLKKIDVFQINHRTVSKATLDILRQEAKDLAATSAAPSTAQRKEMDSPESEPEKNPQTEADSGAGNNGSIKPVPEQVKANVNQKEPSAEKNDSAIKPIPEEVKANVGQKEPSAEKNGSAIKPIPEEVKANVGQKEPSAEKNGSAIKPIPEEVKANVGQKEPSAEKDLPGDASLEKERAAHGVSENSKPGANQSGKKESLTEKSETTVKDKKEEADQHQEKETTAPVAKKEGPEMGKEKKAPGPDKKESPDAAEDKKESAPDASNDQGSPDASKEPAGKKLQQQDPGAGKALAAKTIEKTEPSGEGEKGASGEKKKGEKGGGEEDKKQKGKKGAVEGGDKKEKHKEQGIQPMAPTVPDISGNVSREFHPARPLSEMIQPPSPAKQQEAQSNTSDGIHVKEGFLNDIGSAKKKVNEDVEKEVGDIKMGISQNSATVKSSAIGLVRSAMQESKGKFNAARKQLSNAVLNTQVMVTTQFVTKIAETISKGQTARVGIQESFANYKGEIDGAAKERVEAAGKMQEKYQADAGAQVDKQVIKARSMRDQKVASYPNTERGFEQKNAASEVANQTIGEMLGRRQEIFNSIAEIMKPIPEELNKKAAEAKEGLDGHSDGLVQDIDAKVLEILAQLKEAYQESMKQIPLVQEKMNAELDALEKISMEQLGKIIPQLSTQIDTATKASMEGFDAAKGNLLALLNGKADEAILILQEAESPDPDGVRAFGNSILTYLDSVSTHSVGVFKESAVQMEAETSTVYDHTLDTVKIYGRGTDRALMKWEVLMKNSFRLLVENNANGLKGIYDAMATAFDQVTLEIKAALKKNLDLLKAGFDKTLKDAEPKIKQAITEGLAKNDEALGELSSKMNDAADDAAWDYDHPILSAVGSVLSFIAGLVIGIVAILLLVIVVIVAFKLLIIGLVALGVSLIVAEFIAAVAGLALLARGIYKSYQKRKERGEKGGWGTFGSSLLDVTGVTSIYHGLTADGLSPFQRGLSIGEGVGTIASFFLAKKLDLAISGRLPTSIVSPGGGAGPAASGALEGGAETKGLADIIPIERGRIIRAGRQGGGTTSGPRAYGGNGTALAPSPEYIPEVTPEVVPEVVPEPVPEPIPEAGPVGRAGKSPAPSKVTGTSIAAATGLKNKTKDEDDKKSGAIYQWKANNQKDGTVGVLMYNGKAPPGTDYTTNGHHVWPKVLGGLDSQRLMNVIRTIHSEEMHYGRSPVGSPVVALNGSIYEYLQNALVNSPTYGPGGLDILQGEDLSHNGGTGDDLLKMALRNKGSGTAKNLAAYVRLKLTNYYEAFQLASNPLIPTWSYRKGLDDAYNNFP